MSYLLQLIRWFVWCVASLPVLWRYKIRVNNREALDGLSGGFILPNHIALSDPVITMRTVWPSTGARPVAYKGQYDTYAPAMKLARAFPLNAPQDGNGDWMLCTIRKQLEAVKTAQQNGDNILIYPSGQIKTGITEKLGTKSGVYDMLAANPEAPIVLVRIRGLYGSVLSKYFTGTTDLPKGGHIWKQMKQNWSTFFLPFKRTVVDIDLERIDHVPAEVMESAATFNRWLEDWYNAVPDRLIPGRDGSSFQVDGFEYGTSSSEYDDIAIDESVYKQVVALLQRENQIDPAEVTIDAHLDDGLGIDSFGRATLAFALEETFHVRVSESVELETVRDLVLAAQGYFTETDADALSPDTPEAWVEDGRSKPEWPEAAQSLPHAFLLTRDRVGGSAVACAGTNALGVDEIRTYREKLARAMLIADHIKRMPGDHIGLMLPATVAADVTLLAIMLAGKVAVPFNWTAGATALDQAVETSGVQVILSSELFMQKVQASFSEDIMSRVVTLEGLLAGSAAAKISTVFRLVKGRVLARLSVGMIRSLYPYSMNVEDTAAVLFTSGSESAPKGVPLTHRNVMACVKGVLVAIDGQQNDVMLAFLPPFHSFGFSMEIMLASCTGLKIAYEPDPKRYRRLAVAAQKWQATLIPGTPDFVAGMLDAADDPQVQFASARAFLTGAQKAPDALKAQVAALGKDFFEGYGITETAPLVSVTRPGEVPVGVGKPIDGVTIAIVGIEPAANGTYQLLETGREGRIFVAGPTVFGGYLAGVQDPFVDLGGTRYYNTGDLGFLDREGNLTISGRLKRFIKVAGEMVSLPAVEDVLVTHWPSDEDGPKVAIDGVEGEEGGQGIICLYTRDQSITLESAHAVLSEAQQPGRSWPRYIKQVEEIPLLGTGKVNYRGLPPPAEVAAAEMAAETA